MDWDDDPFHYFPRRRARVRQREGYDIAQICPNGHVANSSFGDNPEFNKDFCDHCGEKTTTKCASCNKPIQGSYKGFAGSYSPPGFCKYCGESFSWTKSKLDAARQLAYELESIADEDRQVLGDELGELVRDTPKTQLAATRVKRILEKAGKGATGIFRDLLTDIVSETAKKMIWP